MKAIELYNDLMVDKILPGKNGMCDAVAKLDGLKSHVSYDFGLKGYSETLLMFRPTGADEERGDVADGAYWLADSHIEGELSSEFGELRQTVLLFIAAMHGEI